MGDTEELTAELRRRWPQAPQEAEVRLSDGTHALDLFLAAAAVKHERWALEAIEHEVFVPIRVQLARRYAASAVEEALQQLRTELIVQGGLKGFAGRGPLKAWILVSAVRRLYAKPTLESAHREESLPDVGSVTPTSEMALIQARYGTVFKAALRRAFSGLPRRQRLLLSMTAEQHLGAQQIARIFHVHRATATEWIADARSALRDSVKAEIQRETGLSDSEFDSIGYALQEQTDLSLPRILANRGAG